MHGFSTADGFVEITEDLAEMIKYVANEPSVGLFYVQQHTQNAVPNIINLKNKMTEKSRETVLHTEDAEDSITVVRSMKDFGSHVADEMIKDIEISLALMSEKQPRRGLLLTATSGFQIGRTNSWGLASRDHGVQQESRISGNYFSTVLKTAKERAGNFKWPQLDAKELGPVPVGRAWANPNPLQLIESASTSLSLGGAESEELPVSSQAADELQTDDEQADDEQAKANLPPDNILSQLENYDKFKAAKEAKLEDWLEGSNDNSRVDKIGLGN